MTGQIVIGSGHAGLRAALAARAQGVVGAITMIDRDQVFRPTSFIPFQSGRTTKLRQFQFCRKTGSSKPT